MIKVFKQNRNIIGNLAIALLLLGGCVFLFTASWNASEIEAASSSCCGGDTTLSSETTSGCCGGTIQLSCSNSNDNSGSNDNDDFVCNCLTREDGTKYSCGICEEGYKCSGSQTPSDCTDDCAREDCGAEGIGNCDSDSAVEYCPKDDYANRRYCQGTSTGCDNKVEVPFEDEDEE